VSLHYERVADRYDAKFHRSLVRSRRDGCMYASVALLHDVDRYFEVPGAAIIRYNPRADVIEKLGIPLPHVYIQSIALDDQRGVIYGLTFTPERLVAFDLATRASRDLGPIGSGLAMAQGENIELDDRGRVWSGWAVTRAWQNTPGVDAARLCRYDPELGHIEYLKAGLPYPDGRHGFAKVEGLFNLGTGCLYASGHSGSIYRIDVETGRATFLVQPISAAPSRLASLRLGPDGMAYGVVGREGHTQVLRFDPRSERYELLGPLVTSDGVRCWQVHDVALTPDGTLYAAENDNPHRSGYLWEVTL